MRPNGLMPVFTNATVHDDVEIELHPDDPECVSIVFGEEQLSLEFIDPDVLDRLAEVARDGAKWLRASIAATEPADTGDDRPVEPAAS